METKVCGICNIEKNINDFYKKNCLCKLCHLLRKQKWRKENPEEYKNQTKKYYEKTKDIQNAKKKIWIQNNREKYNSYWTNRKKSDESFKLLMFMRSRISSFLNKKNISKKNKTFEIIGCSPQELKEYLEKQFTDGMSWENYGLFGWHIDHIIPLSSGKNEEEIHKLCHYTNLQPLWAEDNIRKSDKIV